MTDEEAIIAAVREKLGEAIPVDGDASDTLFTDDQVKAWVASSSLLGVEGDTLIYTATAKGWEAKAAHWAGLVSVSDGAASRAFSDLFEHATTMLKTFTRLASPTSGRARVGKIVRS